MERTKGAFFFFSLEEFRSKRRNARRLEREREERREDERDGS